MVRTTDRCLQKDNEMRTWTIPYRCGHRGTFTTAKDPGSRRVHEITTLLCPQCGTRVGDDPAVARQYDQAIMDGTYPCFAGEADPFRL